MKKDDENKWLICLTQEEKEVQRLVFSELNKFSENFIVAIAKSNLEIFPESKEAVLLNLASIKRVCGGVLLALQDDSDKIHSESTH